MRWLSPLVRKGRPDDRLDREIGFHIAAQTEEYVAQGMTAEEARRRALLDFGGREQVRQSVREVYVSRIAENALFNLKAAMRFMRRAPSFSLVVVLTLTLGIGANSAVFSAINAIVWRPLAFPDGDQLLAIEQSDTQGRDANHFVAPIRVEDWNRMASAFRAISGYYLDDLSETSGPFPEKVTEALVAPRFLEVLSVSPALGRGFTTREEHWGGPNAVLISHGFWQRRFQGDPDAVGRKLHVGSFTYSIVGVMPAGFQFPKREVDLWAPSAPDAPFAKRRDATWFSVIGRMKPGIAEKQARADLINVQRQLGRQFPKSDGELTVETEPLKDTIVGTVRSSMWLLYGSVSLLLLIACSNIAALLLARTAERQHEISIRFSLGASRRSVVAQLLTEVLGLAVVGALLGLGVAAAAVHGFNMLGKTLPRAEEIALDWRVVVYSLVCAVATALFCGLVPALSGTRHGLAHSMARAGRTQASTRSRVQWVLVSVQVTLAVTLLVGAGLLIRSLQAIGRVSPGFDPSGVLTLEISGSWGETTEMRKVVQRIDRTLDSLRSLPGVEAAATSAMLPGVPAKYQQEFKIDGKRDPDRKIMADTRYVSSGYFETMRIPVLLGEPCRHASTTFDVVVNRSFANLYMSGTSALGHTLQQAAASDFTPFGIVRGIVGDAREEGLNAFPAPTVYSCFSAPTPFPNYLIRTRGEPMQKAEAVRRRIHELEPGRSVYAVMPLEEHLDEASSDNRLRTRLLTLFAVTAVSLACIGIYGTLSYLGRLRQREVGVRLALGALRGQIVLHFLMQGLRASLAGSLAGVALAVACSRFLASMLYAVSPLDPVTYLGVVVLILLVAALASLAPALRAARVQPVTVLREE